MTFKKFYEDYESLLRTVVEKSEIKEMELIKKEPKKVLVEVMTSISMGGELKSEVKRKLRGYLSSEIILDNIVSPLIDGGVIVKIGNKIYDGSLKRVLEKIKEKMSEIDLSEQDLFRNINLESLVSPETTIFKNIKDYEDK